MFCFRSLRMLAFTFGPMIYLELILCIEIGVTFCFCYFCTYIQLVTHHLPTELSCCLWGNQISKGLFWDSLICSTDLYIYLCTDTTLIWLRLITFNVCSNIFRFKSIILLNANFLNHCTFLSSHFLYSFKLI